MVLSFLPHLWPSPCKIQWLLPCSYSPWCPQRASFVHLVESTEFLIFLTLVLMTLYHLKCVPRSSSIKHNLCTYLKCRFSGPTIDLQNQDLGWWGGAQTAVLMVSQMILLHAKVWRALLLPLTYYSKGALVSLWQMQKFGPHPSSLSQNLHFLKISK